MKVLIIEDSPDIVESVSLCLALRWPDVKLIAASRGSQGLTLAETESPGFIILDLGLPDVDGFDVLESIRSFSNVPIIILTVRGDEMDRVRGLEKGADDYITKPFSHLELLARMASVLRRTEHLRMDIARKPFHSSRLAIDFGSRTVTVAGQPVKLTPTEYNLLAYLVVNEGNVLTHRALLEKVWGEQYVNAPEYLKVYVQRLRNKLEENPAAPKMLITERGVGYRFIRLSPAMPLNGTVVATNQRRARRNSLTESLRCLTWFKSYMQNCSRAIIALVKLWLKPHG